jgi:cytidylate kinase
MSIITISRGSYSRGKEVAEKVAEVLGYACVSRDILLDASEVFNVSELKLVHAIHDAPSLLDRFMDGKERYIAYVQASLLSLLSEDNIVYHGLAGHFFVREIGHALKVRISADMTDRVALEIARRKIPENEARETLRKDDEQRRKWSRWLYGIDTFDPALYDLVLNIKRLTVDDAVTMICHAAQMGRFRTTPESQRTLLDQALAARVKAAVIKIASDIDVHADKGHILIRAKSSESIRERLAHELAETAGRTLGVKAVAVEVNPTELLSD